MKKFTKKLVAGAAFASFDRKRVKHIFLNLLQQILAVKNENGLRHYDKNFSEYLSKYFSCIELVNETCSFSAFLFKLAILP